MDLKNSQLPTDDPRLEIYSSVNLRNDLSSVIDQLKATVPRLDEVTHMYYCGQPARILAVLESLNVADGRHQQLTQT